MITPRNDFLEEGKMKNRRLLLIVIGILVICMTPTALAETEQAEFAVEQKTESDVLPASAEVYVNESQAVLLLRDMLVAREENAVVYISSSTELTTSDLSDIFFAAMAHTGEPKEGDYIAANNSGCHYSLETSYMDGTYYHTCTFSPVWLSTAEQETQVDGAVDALLAELNLWNASNYEKVKGVYDWITENVQYDFDNLDDDTYTLKHSTYAALIDRVAVCQGYASLYYRLMLELGVDCRYISGVADGENHGWNIVYLDGKYYNVDPTWDRDLMGHYRWFLCTQANFSDHIRDSKYDTAAFHAAYPMAVVPYIFNVTASGTVNSQISWVLDGDTGTLTVAGKGAIPSYRFSYAPWYDYRESVKDIVVSEGITEVGERAFYWCTNCTSVSLPDSLVAIREYGFNNLRALQTITLPPNLKTLEFCAFSECAALTSITLPDSVTEVGSSVFSNCPALISATLSNGMKTIPSSMFFNDRLLRIVKLPEGITYIDSTAFSSCGLTEITLPASLTGLGTSVFSDCRYLKNIYVAAGNPSFKSVNGVLFSSDGKTLICYPSGKYGSYSVPEGTVEIAYGAFRGNSNLTAIYFPSTLKTIGNYSFSYCTGLYQVTFPANITRICDSAFRSCTYLSSINFQNESVILESGGVFAECDALYSVTLPQKISEVPGYLFYGCGNLKYVTIPATANKIGSSAFLDCDRLESITIPGNIKSIGRQAFDFCNRLKTITIQEGVTTLEDYCIRNAPSLTTVVIPNSVTSIGKECFDICPNVTLQVNCGSYGYRYAIIKNISHTASHPYTSQQIISPTCTSQGYTRMQCACGDYFYQTNFVAAKGHNYNTTMIAPTCTTNGYTHYLCTVCGYFYDDDVIPAPGHNMVSENYKAPTCTEDGYSGEGTCQVCGVHLSDGQVIPATGHSFGSWIVIKDANCTESGSEQRICQSCRLSENRELPATGHSFRISVIEPTCTEEGYTSRTCIYCSSNYTDTYTKPLGHNYGTWITTNAPTCTSYGGQMRQCTRCRNWETQVVPPTGHTYIDGVCTGCGAEDPDYVQIGDLDGDGEISDWDAILLNRYMAGWNVELSLAAADIDADGEITDWDAILLDRYMAGWNINLN